MPTTGTPRSLAETTTLVTILMASLRSIPSNAPARLRSHGPRSPPQGCRARIDQAGRGRGDLTSLHGHEGIGDRHIVESVDSGRLEVKAQQLAGHPCGHGVSLPRGCWRLRDARSSP